jgi:hypothetical protein
LLTKQKKEVMLEYCLMPNEKKFIYVMSRASYILMRWCPLCTTCRLTRFIILESNLEFERAKRPTCSKYLHTSTGILSLIISQLQRSSIVSKNNLDKWKLYLCHVESKLHFNEMMSALYYMSINTPRWICTVIAILHDNVF